MPNYTPDQGRSGGSRGDGPKRGPSWTEVVITVVSLAAGLGFIRSGASAEAASSFVLPVVAFTVGRRRR